MSFAPLRPDDGPEIELAVVSAVLAAVAAALATWAVEEIRDAVRASREKKTELNG